MNSKTFTFIRGMTGLVVLLYVGTAVFAFAARGLSWPDFSTSVGTLAGMLLGFWIKGEKNNE